MTTFQTTARTVLKHGGLERTTRTCNLRPPGEEVLPSQANPHHSQKGAPPVPQRFKLISEGGNDGLLVNDKALLDRIVIDLDLGRPESGFTLADGIDGGCYVIGPHGQSMQQVQDFANLFTSLRGTLPDDAKEDDRLGRFCAGLVMRAGLKLSEHGILSGSKDFVDMLAWELQALAKENPALAFAVFRQCSTSTRVAIRESNAGPTFVTTISEVKRLQTRCANLLACDADRAVIRGDSQLLKQFLLVCTDRERSDLVSVFSFHEERIVLLCTADPELAQMLVEAVSSAKSPFGLRAPSLHARLIQLPQRTWNSDGKVPDPVDLGRKKDILKTLGRWGLLTPSGGLYLKKVPMPWDLPVTEIIALMTMESSDTAFRLAHHLFMGFAGDVKRSSPLHWATADAIRAFKALEAYVAQLERAEDPIVPLAREVCKKFRKALVTAWAAVDAPESKGRVMLLMDLLPVLDGHELALWRSLQPIPHGHIDQVLHEWSIKRFDAAQMNQVVTVNDERRDEHAALKEAMLPSGGTTPLENDAAELAATAATSADATRLVQQIASTLQAAPEDYELSRSVRQAFYGYFSELTKASHWQTLADCCTAFGGPSKSRHPGQVFLANLLGSFVWELWRERQAVQCANVLATFLNTGAITPAAMKEFARSTYGIFESPDVKAWWKNHASLFTDDGKQARFRWVDAVLQLLSHSLVDSPALIKRQNSLRTLLK